MTLVHRSEVLAAGELLHDVVRRTPVEHSRPLSELVGGDVMLKCENLQRAGSFKIRGAYVRISRLSDDERGRGVVAASAGNHAQGVALAASLLGAKATVFMPEGAPLPKVEATRGYGADVRFAGATLDEALVHAREFADETGATLVHPFDNADIIAGQGTVGLEIVEQCPEVRTIVVSAGGGGLVSGIAAALEDRDDVRIVAVQAAGAAAFPASLAAGRPVPLESMSTMADGIAVGRPGDLTYAQVEQMVDDVVTVPEAALSRAMLLCLERNKLLVEAAGAAGVAAVMEDPTAFEPPVVVVLSGGNIDPLLVLRLLRHGMWAAGRYLAFRVRVPDRPGHLAKLLGELADSGGNVLEIEHRRTGPELNVDEVEISVQLELRGPGHREEVVARLQDAGYTLDYR